MPTYSRFDDVSNLVSYWNAAESIVNTTGTVVNSVEPVYGNDPFVLNSIRSDIIHDPGVITIGDGDLDAFQDPLSAKTDATLEGDFNSLINPPNVLTIVTVYQTNSGFATGESIWQLYNSENNSQTRQFADGTSNHQIWPGTTKTFTNTDRIQSPEVSIVTIDYVNGTVDFWWQGAKQTRQTFTAPYTDEIKGFTFMGRSNNSSWSIDGWGSIAAVYDKAITDEEASGIHDLCRYWLDNGQGPEQNPTSGSFDVVATNDDPNVTWQWQESGNDGSTWGPVGTIITNYEGQGTNELTVTAADTSINGTIVRCKATTSYGEAFSETALLTVTAS